MRNLKKPVVACCRIFRRIEGFNFRSQSLACPGTRTALRGSLPEIHTRFASAGWRTQQVLARGAPVAELQKIRESLGYRP